MTSKIEGRTGFLDSGLNADENLQHWNRALVAHQRQIIDNLQ
jgi:hypothetical protein